jgi:succinate-semialdehyde dehydrogenase/glutarate-semialdehyde dehydrogenase
MPAFDEELFGPVAAIVPVRDAAAAVRLANATPYGLAATIFTRNLARARRLAREIEAGAVFINELVRTTPELPFGGTKASGHGRELGAWGARAFVNVQTIWEAP